MTKSVQQVGVHHAKTHLSDLLRRVDAGEEFEIVRNGAPVARLVPVGGRPRRTFGHDAGLVQIAEDFDLPLSDELLAEFEG
jgi:prevent-host-death family protein